MRLFPAFSKILARFRRPNPSQDDRDKLPDAANVIRTRKFDDECGWHRFECEEPRFLVKTPIGSAPTPRDLTTFHVAGNTKQGSRDHV